MSNKPISEKGYKDNRPRGFYYEHKLRDILKVWGFKCKSFRKSGQKKDRAVADLELTIDDKKIRIENKMRKLKTVQGLYDLVAPGDRHIENFCIALTQASFRSLIVDKVAPEPHIAFDEKISLLHEFFAQDDADIVTVVSRWKQYIFFVRPSIYEFLIQRTDSRADSEEVYSPTFGELVDKFLKA